MIGSFSLCTFAQRRKRSESNIAFIAENTFKIASKEPLLRDADSAGAVFELNFIGANVKNKTNDKLRFLLKIY